MHGVRPMSVFNRSKQLFPPAEEDVLVAFARNQAQRQLPLTHPLLHEKANRILKLHTHPPFTVGKTWSYRFLNRHRPELAMYWSSNMDDKRAHALNPTNSKEYFEVLTEICPKHHIQPKFKFAMDESPIFIGRNVPRVQVIGPAKAKRQAKRQDDNRESLSLVVTICADGSIPMPPTIIFTGKNFMKRWSDYNVLNVT